MHRRTTLALLLVVLPLCVALSPSTTSAAPSAADQATGPYVGMWTTGSPAEAGQLDQLGVGWARVTAVWATVQPAPGTFDFADLDAQVSAASGGGKRQVVIMVRNNAPWAAASRCKVSNNDERTNLANFLTALVARYKDQVKHWQLYNEMDNTSEAFDQRFDLGGCFGTASGTTPTQAGRDNYAQMLEVVGTAIHGTDPAAKVVSGALVSGNFLDSSCPTCLFDSDFIRGVLAKLKADGMLDRLDAVAVHYFSEQAVFFNAFGPDLLGRVNKLRQDMRNAGLGEDQLKSIVMDEGSFTVQPAGVSNGDPNNPFNQAQRNYVIKALSRAAFADLTAYYWFWLRDASSGLGADNAYGLIALDGSQKPSYRAFQYFLSLVNRQDQLVGRLNLPSSKLEGYEFKAADGRRLQVVWNEADNQTIDYNPPFGVVGAITDPSGAPVGPTNQGAVSVGAEPRLILSPSCSPRPSVGVSVAPIGGGRLQVTLNAGRTASVPNNRLFQLHFSNGNNLLIDVPGGPTNASGTFDVNLSSVTGTTFTIRRANPGVTSGITALTVTDGCGSWPTFVGGGPSAF